MSGIFINVWFVPIDVQDYVLGVVYCRSQIEIRIWVYLYCNSQSSSQSVAWLKGFDAVFPFWSNSSCTRFWVKKRFRRVSIFDLEREWSCFWIVVWGMGRTGPSLFLPLVHLKFKGFHSLIPVLYFAVLVQQVPVSNIYVGWGYFKKN